MQKSDELILDPATNIAFTRLRTIMEETGGGEHFFKSNLTGAFNQGVMSVIKARSKDTLTVDEASRKLTKDYLPSSFSTGPTGDNLLAGIFESIRANSTNGALNVGYELVLAEIIREVIKISYALGVTAGFEISSDEVLRKIYLASADRFEKGT